MDARVSVLEEQVREVEGLMGRAKGKRTETMGMGGWGVGENSFTLSPPPPTTTTMGLVLPLTPDSIVGAKKRDSPSQDAFIAGNNFTSEVTTLPGIVPDLLPFENAQALLTRFRNKTIPQFPLILLPSKTTTLSALATSKPTLLLALFTAASSSGPGLLFKTLHAELTKRLAMRVIVNGERSLELVQALLVMEVWYCIPEDGEEGVNFYQWIHVAATMALQLGLGKMDCQEVEREEAMEEARILLGVWLSCSS